MLCEAQIDVGALAHNLNVVRDHAKQQHVLAFLKGNAYGHGLLEAAQGLEAADGFGVAWLDHACALRAAFPHHTVVLLSSACTDASFLDTLFTHALDWVVFTSSQVDALVARGRRHGEPPLTVWLKLDTGMHRMGFATEAWCAAYETLSASEAVGEVVLMSHLGQAGTPDHPKNASQLANFKRVADQFKVPTSLANSAGLMAFPATHGAWVRPGLMLYGLPPYPFGSDRFEATRATLRPAMTLRGRLLATSTVDANATVGYGARWASPHPTRLGVVACGYAYGYPRNAPDDTPLWCEGHALRLAGRVSMDVLTVDLGQTPVQEGAWVECWGSHVSVAEVAHRVDRSAYDCLTGVSSGVQRVTVGGQGV